MIYFGDKCVSLKKTSEKVIEKDVNFYDYDGTLLYSYTKSEALEVTALPPLHDRTSENLTNEGWNWTLTEIKEQLTDVGGIVNVGCTYHPTDGRTHIFVNVLEDQLDAIGLQIKKDENASTDVTIHWGDNTASTVSSTSGAFYSHTYSNVGVYDISIEGDWRVDNFNQYLFGSVYKNCIIRATKLHLGGNLKEYIRNAFRNISFEYLTLSSYNIDNWNVTWSNFFSNTFKLKCLILPRVTELPAGLVDADVRTVLKTLVLPPTVTVIRAYDFRNNKIDTITIPKNATMHSTSNTYVFSGSLIEKITIPSTITSIGNYYFSSCNQLKEVHFPDTLQTIGDLVFYYNVSLKTLTIPASVTSIGSRTFERCWSLSSLYMKPTTPPTIQADTFSTGSSSYTNPLVRIYVPRASCAAYKAATNWSTWAANIYPYDYDAIPDALYFYMTNGGDITLTKNDSPTEVTLEYSLDCGDTWTTWIETNNVRTLTLTAGQTMFVRNTSETSTEFSTGDDGTVSDYYKFSFSNTTESGGPIESLICKNPQNASYINRATFRNLFYGESNLITPPKIIGTSIRRRSLQNTFAGTGIVETPELMFTSVPNYGLYRTFQNCSNLKIVKVHFTTLGSSSPLYQWLSNVAATGDLYCPSTLTITTDSVSGIPTGWTRHDID